MAAQNCRQTRQTIFFAVGPLDVEMTALKGKFFGTYCSHGKTLIKDHQITINGFLRSIFLESKHFRVSKYLISASLNLDVHTKIRANLPP